MSILQQILAAKHEEVRSRKELFPTKLLERSPYFATPTVSMKKYLSRTDLVGVIAEIKRKSPSKGALHPHLSVEALSIGYMQAGASALSVLTDEKFFGGSNADLTTARKFNFCPVLRKDFIIDEYQLIEARSIGADVVLLIASALPPARIAELCSTAKGLGLEVLLEVHSLDELNRSPLNNIDLIGVNNRNLADFSVSLDRSLTLTNHIPPEFIKISESGINSASDLHTLRSAGYNGFLIGEQFLKAANPALACENLIRSALRTS